MSHAKYLFLKRTFPFRQHTTQTRSPNSAKHRTLDPFKIKGLVKDLKQFLKEQNHTLVYPLIRKLFLFGSRKHELKERILLELEIVSSKQREIMERFKEMEEVGEQVRELLLLVKALSERETERGRGREEFDALERRLDALSGRFEQISISAPTRRVVDSESSLVAREMNTSLDSSEEDSSGSGPSSLKSVPLEPSTPEEERGQREEEDWSLEVMPSVSNDDEFPFRNVAPPNFFFELTALGGRRRMG